MQLVSKVHKICGEHVVAWNHKKIISQPSRWVPPAYGFFKVNCDVAVREDFSAGAAVIKNHKGLIVGACVERFSTVDPEEGEIRVVQLGLEEAFRCDLS